MTRTKPPLVPAVICSVQQQRAQLGARLAGKPLGVKFPAAASPCSPYKVHQWMTACLAPSTLLPPGHVSLSCSVTHSTCSTPLPGRLGGRTRSHYSTVGACARSPHKVVSRTMPQRKICCKAKLAQCLGLLGWLKGRQSSSTCCYSRAPTNSGVFTTRIVHTTPGLVTHLQGRRPQPGQLQSNPRNQPLTPTS